LRGAEVIHVGLGHRHNQGIALDMHGNRGLQACAMPHSPPISASRKEMTAMSRQTVELDQTDWKILRHLQDDGRMTNVELASRVGISAPPCLRRVKKLEDAGIIKGYRALLDGRALGQTLTAFCLIGLHHQSDADLKAFAEKCRGWPLVRAAWTIQGEADYMLACVAPDLVTFQDFVIDELTGTGNVDTVRTALTIRQVKDEGWVAFPD
jgi:DNA-binding Lrp family transcriptional regulator